MYLDIDRYNANIYSNRVRYIGLFLEVVLRN